jgi:mRNA interferase RelE/StbE
MARYEIRFKRSVLKDLARVPRKDVTRIMAAIEHLAEDPRPPGAAKLSGDEKYRLRVGVCRVLCSIEDDRLVVVVVKARHRRDAYRQKR